jgi:hypothetical protein
MNCFRCVQSCPKELIHKSINPDFKAIGDRHWTPDIIARLWYQAETGKIPVSGAGYPGPFSGPGFDSMWTDMSEIVRPTRDGIHGREYISTAVDIGKTPTRLRFDPPTELTGEVPSMVDIPLPILMRVPPFGSISTATLKGWSMAARRLGTFLAVPEKMVNQELMDFQAHLMPVIPSGPTRFKLSGDAVRLVEYSRADHWESPLKEIKKAYPSALISIRLPLVEGVEEKTVGLVRAGINIIYLEGNHHGRALDDDRGFLKDGIRSVHLKLVDEGIRDEITILAGGGIAMPEHVAKSLICGADAVFVDFPLLIALECRMCRRCEKGLSCPVDIQGAEGPWVASRLVNILGAWHSQLLEVMGAMGIRDARRLRGEAGRAMFFEELDHATFGNMGELKEGFELE